MKKDISSDCRHLVLKLEKSPELLRLMDTNTTPTCNNPELEIARKYRDQPDHERMKASIFPASKLEIGSWKSEAQGNNDLVTNFYYYKKAVVWEVLYEDRKRKMQMLWSDVSALRAIFVEGRPTTLEIELDKPPEFFINNESDDPRKHSVWNPTDDFTDGQASEFRRHRLTVAAGVLEKHFEKLIYSSGDLYVLNLRPFPKHHSPFFDPNKKQVLPNNSEIILRDVYIQPHVNMRQPDQVFAFGVNPLSYAPPVNSGMQLSNHE